ncbi:DUF7857 domain-containing protein [Haloarcula salina]|uniref:DUF8080 domain-containing protein n=1 Tax=Haloarcula salina TaxID=1429914 RepID=A0AA41KFU7_9EURY|nr:hypothetical protein [Haloarcula salina]MBV0902382.1 hypothetical protein [Haloarcula salina]
MVTFDCRAERFDGVTLVTAVVSGVTEPTRLTVANRLDGPVYPPRRQGVSEAGWTDDGFEGVVRPGTRALGYATPAPAADSPAELVSAEPVSDPPTDDRLDTEEAVLRELGDPSPPADAVPTDDADAPPTAEPTATARSDGPPVDRATTAGQPLPDDVSRWLDTVARRVDRAEALAAADSLGEATEAVRAAGGLTGVRTLATRGSVDERCLRSLARRAERLADRRAAATVPVETLARLA